MLRGILGKYCEYWEHTRGILRNIKGILGSAERTLKQENTKGIWQGWWNIEGTMRNFREFSGNFQEIVRECYILER